MMNFKTSGKDFINGSAKMAGGFYRKLFYSDFRKIGGAALLLGGASLASRLLGVFRDRILAGTFGAGDELDVYYAAFRLPDLIFNLVVLGVLSAGFIPVFSRFFYNRREKEAWALTNTVLNLLGFLLIILSLALILFAPELVRLLTPGFSGEKFRQTVELTRIVALSPIFLGLSAVLGDVLQSLRRFFAYAVAPILYNLGIILGAIFLVPVWGLKGLAFGVVAGSFLHFLAQIPPLFGTGYRFKFFPGWKQEGLKEMVVLMMPRMMTLVLLQLNFLAITVIASFLASGSLAVFNLSFNIWSFPLGIFAASFVVASFPALSENAAQKNWPEFKKTFVYAFRQILFYLVPSSALFIILRAQIVRVILGSGEFGWNDTILTIESLKFLTLGLFAEGLTLLLSRAFFALYDAKTPFWIGLFGTMARVFGAWFFAQSLGAPGLALGFAGGAILQMILLWIFLERKVGVFDFKDIFSGGLKIAAASFLAGLGAWLGLRFGARFVDMQTGHGLLLQGALAGLFGILVYLMATSLMKLRETGDLTAALFTKFSLKKIKTKEDISSTL